MQHKKVKISVLALLYTGLISVQAQDAIPATGGNASGSEGSVSYSIGQVVNITCTGIGGFIAQGVQQPYEISVISGIEEATGINLDCMVFPNPTHDFLILFIENSNNLSLATLSFSIYDISGKLLESNKIEGYETIIPVQNLVPAIYFLKVIDHGKEIKSFKIIKK